MTKLKVSDADLLPCPFCGSAMMLRDALWPSEGDTDGILHAAPTDCPLPEFSVSIADECVSVAAAWNKRALSPPEPTEGLSETLKRFKWGEDYGKDLLIDINQLAHAAGTGALYRDVLQRAYKEIFRARAMPLQEDADWKLPCDVTLPPSTVISKGCRLSTLIAGLRARAAMVAEDQTEAKS